MIDHLRFPSLLTSWGDSRSGISYPVISSVMPRPLSQLDRCGSLAIIRRSREGTDPAMRGLAKGRSAWQATGGES